MKVYEVFFTYIEFSAQFGPFFEKILGFYFTVKIMSLKTIMVFLENSFQSNNNVTNSKYQNEEELLKFRYFSFIVNLPHSLSLYLTMLIKDIL